MAAVSSAVGISTEKASANPNENELLIQTIKVNLFNKEPFASKFREGLNEGQRKIFIEGLARAIKDSGAHTSKEVIAAMKVQPIAVKGYNYATDAWHASSDPPEKYTGNNVYGWYLKTYISPEKKN